MHITIKRNDFHAVLTRASAVAPKRPSILILSHVLLRVSGENLFVSATDLEISIQLPCLLIHCETPGWIALPAAKLKDLVEMLPDETVELRLLDNFRAEITSGEHVSRLAGMDPLGFPSFSPAEEAECSPIHADDLHRIIKAVSHAISSDASALHLNGIFFQAESDMLCGIATDGHRVSMAGKRIDDISDWGRLAGGVIVPRRGVEEIKRLPSSRIDLYVGKSSLDLLQCDTSLLVRLVDGTYPAWRNYIPKDYKSFFTVDSGALIDAVNRVSLLSDGGSVRFEAKDETLFLYAESATNEAIDSISYIPGGNSEEELSFRFNSRYLLDALGSLGGGYVVFKYRDANSPFLLFPADYGRWDERMELVLPLRV